MLPAAADASVAVTNMQALTELMCTAAVELGEAAEEFDVELLDDAQAAASKQTAARAVTRPIKVGP